MKKIMTVDRKEVPVSLISKEAKLDNIDVYNITVSNSHNYYVSKGKYLVHNKACGNDF